MRKRWGQQAAAAADACCPHRDSRQKRRATARYRCAEARDSGADRREEP